MRVLIIYESMYGNTRLIARAIGAGAGRVSEVSVHPVAEAREELLAGADLVVLGGPTHIHGMSSARSRQAAVQAAREPGSKLALDADAEGSGLREWFASLGQLSAMAAAFDTRLDGPAAFTGRASKTISKQLAKHGFRIVSKPQSFLVSMDNQLRPGERDRAAQWGSELVSDAVRYLASARRA